MVQQEEQLVQEAVKCFLEHLPPETDFFSGYQTRKASLGKEHLTNGDVEVMTAFLKKHGLDISESDISRNKVAERIVEEFLRLREAGEPVEGPGQEVGQKM